MSSSRRRARAHTDAGAAHASDGRGPSRAKSQCRGRASGKQRARPRARGKKTRESPPEKVRPRDVLFWTRRARVVRCLGMCAERDQPTEDGARRSGVWRDVREGERSVMVAGTAAFLRRFVTGGSGGGETRGGETSDKARQPRGSPQTNGRCYWMLAASRLCALARFAGLFHANPCKTPRRVARPRSTPTHPRPPRPAALLLSPPARPQDVLEPLRHRLRDLHRVRPGHALGCVS